MSPEIFIIILFFFQSHNYRFEYMLQTRNLNSAFYMLRNSASFSFQKKKKEKKLKMASNHISIIFSFFLRSPLGDETLTVQALIPTCPGAISLLLQDTVASPMLARGWREVHYTLGPAPHPSAQCLPGGRKGCLQLFSNMEGPD